MTRDPAAIVGEPNEYTPVPNLTYENAAEHLLKADYIVLTIGSALPPDRFARNGSGIKYRTEYLTEAFQNEFSDIIVNSERGSAGGTLKITPKKSSTLQDIESLIYDLVPLWRSVAIGYAWMDHEYPLGNALLYQMTDKKPPHPDTEKFKRNYFHPAVVEMDEEKEELQYEKQEQNVLYSDSEDDPRFEYGPSMILNGAYNGYGCDVYGYGIDNVNVAIFFDIGIDSPPQVASPPVPERGSAQAGSVKHLEVKELTGKMKTVTRDNALLKMDDSVGIQRFRRTLFDKIPN